MHNTTDAVIAMTHYCYKKLNENISQEYARAQKKVRLLTLERRYFLIIIPKVIQWII